MAIYKNDLEPTYLYIKQHTITGLKYFGKPTSNDPIKYPGSGTYWKNHIKKHGKQHIKTRWVSEPFTDRELIKEAALKFSIDNNIVESKEWANLIVENGLDGPEKGRVVTEEGRANMSAAQKGREFSEEHKQNLSIAWQNRPPITDETKSKLAAAAIGKIRQPHTEETKLKMSESAKNRPPVSEETGRKIAASNTGKTHSDETKKVLSDLASNRPKKECPHCKKIIDITCFARWHGDNCASLKPKVPKVQKIPQPRKENAGEFKKGQEAWNKGLKLSDEDKQKLANTPDKEKIECEHCGKITRKSNYTNGTVLNVKV